MSKFVKQMFIMDTLPKDPYILLSYINTKLRDDYDSLDELCESMDISRNNLESTLNAAGFEYEPSGNRFV